MSADQPTAAAAVGRTREELAAASAALLAAGLDVDCSDAQAFLRRRARRYDQQALDAPPAHLVPDENLLRLLESMLASGGASVVHAVGMVLPGQEEQVTRVAQRVAVRILADPAAREQLLTMARGALAGRCTCGQELGHAGGHPGSGGTTMPVFGGDGS